MIKLDVRDFLERGIDRLSGEMNIIYKGQVALITMVGGFLDD